MSLSDVLNSDLGSIGRDARRGFDGWVEELRDLVPPSIRTWSTRANVPLVFDGQAFAQPAGGTFVPALGDPIRSDVTVVLDRAHVLTRTVELPAMTRADIARLLSLNAERYFPLPTNTALIASAPRAGAAVDGQRPVDVAAITMAHATALARAIDAARIRPRDVRAMGDDGQIDRRFDFLPVMQAAGLVPNWRDARRKWWLLVAALAVLNVAMLIWRDAASVERWQALVDAQRPAVSVAQRIVARMQTTGATAQSAGERRRQRDPLAVLALTTDSMPDGAWVQRYAWDGRELRLTGYRSRDADVAGALRRVPGFANVRSTQTDSVAETATGQPFDLVAQVGGR